ncbi:UDP-N-acetylmuramoyl-tripeptide--D-alanyl-D-alanine ligase [Psychrosphaera sp. F3M07]|uniref:UDP-N-acetylmuramoyl-tripeptide--D-alanyl-D- alanine ligase n=1 Tax=Psychrosphaera sp. F3M07 TaxID=2841560 RepID=UPI001C08AB35|nr:UDP-N-acetylmuramoyl-tripeptide--D-alanyl-D-alanine ligase [Psychrosphaera sp. F3M07]MBU2916814.1 UDP-N-acetylmuramoyl-tripeptide--D-alanyl-D-alanine ligase [Psychrosphaera sp. F3M07]
MINVSLKWIIDTLSLTDEQIVNVPVELEQQGISAFSTDSRTIEAGHVFVALRGPNFDSNAFIGQVKDKGAVAVIVDTPSPVDIPQFIVKDTLIAYGKLAAKVAATVKPKTIAITGSVGKTSVKEMCAAILAQKGNVLATNGNFNNEIGVPHTLMRLEPSHEYAVIELGANHIGEIAYTTELTQPDVAILNNVAEAHLEGFGDIYGVVRAKGEIFNSLSQTGIAIVNGDSEYKEYWLTRLNDKFENSENNIIQFGFNPDLTSKGQAITASNITLNKLGCASFTLKLDLKKGEQQQIDVELVIPGKHNVNNALAAAAACYSVGADLQDIKNGLLAMQSVKGRVNLHQVTDSLLVIDDTYNANVQSAKAAIDLLSGYQGKKIFVLGDMAELGSGARRYHQDVGEYANEQNIDVLLSIGVLSQSASSVMEQKGEHFSSQQNVISRLNQLIKDADCSISILIKGSRSAKMEQIVEQIIADNNLSN